ncbi:DUF6185 family protein [Streptomyces sp. NPDC002851]
MPQLTHAGLSDVEREAWIRGRRAGRRLLRARRIGGPSVVDAALALGPHDNWWANGRRAARVAALIGLPASGLLVWAENIKGEFLTSTLNSQFGLPDIA